MAVTLDFSDRVAIVTGGAHGIGRSIAELLIEAGATVAIADIDDKAGYDAARQLGSRAKYERCDVTDLQAVQALVETVVGRHGRVDLLVNNAGWDRFALFLDSTPDLWQRLIALNYTGVLNTCYATLPQMKMQGGGAIVNLASDAARGGSMGESVYAGCKAAVIAFSKTIAREHARDNIRVNVVAPGVTETALLAGMRTSELGNRVMSAIAKSVPLGRRAGRTDEIAPAVLFLASDHAAYITGQVLSVSGGLTMVD